ncbi:MAG: flagellar biosynthesis protein FlhF [Spirochaetia bacterium]
MQYFTEQAESHKEAIEKIRIKYGENARILKHKSVKLGGFLGLFSKEGIEVSGFVSESPVKKSTYNLEEEKRKILDNLRGDTKTLQTLLDEVREIKTHFNEQSSRKPEESLHPTLKKVEKHLEKNDFSPSFVAKYLSRCRRTFSMDELDDYELVARSVAQWIGESVPLFEDAWFRNKPTVCILVGPTGVGKTTTLAKLAATYGLETSAGRKPVSVRLFTADNYRIGAKNQLETYGDIMGIPVASVQTTEEFKKKMAIYRDADLILVDTTGKSPRNYKGLAEMREILDGCGPDAEVHLALSATTKSSDIEDIMQQFEPFDYKSVILTKLDETTHIGNVLSVLIGKGKPISFVTFGQGVPLDIERASVERIFKHLEGFSALYDPDAVTDGERSLEQENG